MFIPAKNVTICDVTINDNNLKLRIYFFSTVLNIVSVYYLANTLSFRFESICFTNLYSTVVKMYI